MDTKNVEQLHDKIERLSNLSMAMQIKFLMFMSVVNRAVGAANITETFSPEGYVDEAEKILAQLEGCIKNYHENLPQDFEGDVK
jgi:hypothetical protein